MGHSLKRDCKTRWNTMLDSIQSGLDIKPALKQFLQYHPLSLTDLEWEKLEELATVLGPCKATFEALCREDADLLSKQIKDLNDVERSRIGGIYLCVLVRKVV